MGRVQLLCLILEEHLVVALGWMVEGHFDNVQVVGEEVQSDLGVEVGGEVDLVVLSPA